MEENILLDSISCSGLNKSNRKIDPDTGYPVYENCTVAKVGIAEYNRTSNGMNYLLKLYPDLKKFSTISIYKDQDFLDVVVNKFNGKQLLDEHPKITGEVNIKNNCKKIELGVIKSAKTENEELKVDYIIHDLKAKEYIEKADKKISGGKKELSVGWKNILYIREDGEYNGKKYQLKMIESGVNRTSLTDNARIDGAVICDSNNFLNDEDQNMEEEKMLSLEKEIQLLTKESKCDKESIVKIKEELTNSFKIQEELKNSFSSFISKFALKESLNLNISANILTDSAISDEDLINKELESIGKKDDIEKSKDVKIYILEEYKKSQSIKSEKVEEEIIPTATIVTPSGNILDNNISVKFESKSDDDFRTLLKV